MNAPDPHILNALRKEILLMQGYKPGNSQANLGGLEAIADVFPNGSFPLGAIHEFFCFSKEDGAASYGFIAGIVSTLMETGAPVVWISSGTLIYPPALKSFQIDPDKILFIKPPKPKDLFWVLEETLKNENLPAVICDLNELSFTESRRLQLAVEHSKNTGFLIRQKPKNLATACLARWKIKSAESLNEGVPGLGYPQWDVELLKIRNGKPGKWKISWQQGRFQIPKQPLIHILEKERKAG